MTYEQGCQKVIQEKNVILGKIMGQSFIQAQLPPVSMGLPPKEESIWKSLHAKILFLKIFMYPNLFPFLVYVTF